MFFPLIIITKKLDENDAYALFGENDNFKLLEKLVRDEEEFTQNMRTWEDSLLISVFDGIVGMLKENRTLFDLVLKLKRIIKAANMMSQSLVLQDALHEAIEEVVEQTCECLGCDRATLWLLDEEKEELWSKVAKGSKEEIRIPQDRGIVGTKRRLFTHFTSIL